MWKDLNGIMSFMRCVMEFYMADGKKIFFTILH